jgi:hypothetical protein
MKLLAALLFALTSSVGVVAQDSYVDSDVSNTRVSTTQLYAASGAINALKVSGTANVSGTLRATALVGDGSGLTGIPAGTSSPSYYAVLNVPTPLQAVSNSAAIVMSGISATNVSVTGNVSAAKFYGDGAALTGLSNSPSWYAVQGIPTAVQNVSNGLIISATTHNGFYASYTTLAAGLVTAPTVSGTNVISMTALGAIGGPMMFCGGQWSLRSNSFAALYLNACYDFMFDSADSTGGFKPTGDLAYNIGAPTLRWGHAYFGTVSATSYAGSNAIFHSVTFTGSPTTALIKGFNTGAITRIASGQYGVSFSTPALDTSYTLVCTAMRLTNSVFVSIDNSFPPRIDGYVLRVIDDTSAFRDSGRVSCMGIQ